MRSLPMLAAFLVRLFRRLNLPISSSTLLRTTRRTITSSAMCRLQARCRGQGQETVLDAIQYGGGLLNCAEPKDIRLVRPGRGGKPAKVYKVDLAAIQERGDVTTNYQIFPDDRLIVGRNELVKKTASSTGSPRRYKPPWGRSRAWPSCCARCRPSTRPTAKRF